MKRPSTVRTDLAIIALTLTHRLGCRVMTLGSAICSWASMRRAKVLIAGTGWQTGRREL
jgi:hypothetical protein